MLTTPRSATVINYGTNEYRFIRRCVTSVPGFSSQVQDRRSVGRVVEVEDVFGLRAHSHEPASSLHIIYRTCGGEDTRETHKRSRKHKGDGLAPFERTEWFDKAAYFKSVAQELDDDVKVTIVYDGDQPRLREYLRREWVDRYAARFAFHQIQVNDNRKSLMECYRLADADTSSEYLYFLEDDYLHRAGWLRVLREGFEALPHDAVITLYDHRDRYRRTDDVTTGQESIRLSASTHWRTAESTTCTWAIRRSLWPRVRATVLQHMLRDREVFRSLIVQGIRVWQPIPGYSTHDHVKRLSPLVDWRAVRERL